MLLAAVAAAALGALPACCDGALPSALHASCESVRAHFVDQPQIAATIALRERHDDNLQLCAFENHTTERRSTCCSEQSERAFEAQAWRDYNDSIHRETDVIRSLLSKTTAAFRDGFMDMVDRAEWSAVRAFGEHAGGGVTQTDQRALQRFFSDLRVMLQGRSELDAMPENVTAAANSLLDHIFARMFFRQHVLSSKDAGGVDSGQHGRGGGELSNEYAACVRRSRHAVDAPLQPPGPAVHDFVARLARGVSAAAGLLHALQLAAETVATAAEQAPLTADCVKDIVKMSYCGSCYGQPVQKPCTEFCTDVLGVCMGELRKLERSWDYHLSALRMLVEFTLRQGYVQALLSAVGEELVAGAVRGVHSPYRGANAAILYDQVVSMCGQPRVQVAHGGEASDVAAAAPTSGVDGYDTAAQELGIEVKKFLMLLDSELRGFFGRLPPSICMTDRYYDTSAGHDCWDGLMIKSDGKTKRLEFLQELAPKPPQLDSLENLKRKLAAVRKEYLDKFLRREPQLSQDSEDDGPDGSGAGSGSAPPERPETEQQPELVPLRSEQVPLQLQPQHNQIGGVQSSVNADARAETSPAAATSTPAAAEAALTSTATASKQQPVADSEVGGKGSDVQAPLGGTSAAARHGDTAHLLTTTLLLPLLLVTARAVPGLP